jgi:hypothetical protein
MTENREANHPGANGVENSCLGIWVGSVGFQAGFGSVSAGLGIGSGNRGSGYLDEYRRRHISYNEYAGYQGFRL